MVWMLAHLRDHRLRVREISQGLKWPGACQLAQPLILLAARLHIPLIDVMLSGVGIAIILDRHTECMQTKNLKTIGTASGTDATSKPLREPCVHESPIARQD